VSITPYRSYKTIDLISVLITKNFQTHHTSLITLLRIVRVSLVSKVRI